MRGPYLELEPTFQVGFDSEAMSLEELARGMAAVESVFVAAYRLSAAGGDARRREPEVSLRFRAAENGSLVLIVSLALQGASIVADVGGAVIVFAWLYHRARVLQAGTVDHDVIEVAGPEPAHIGAPLPSPRDVKKRMKHLRRQAELDITLVDLAEVARATGVNIDLDFARSRIRFRGRPRR